MSPLCRCFVATVTMCLTVMASQLLAPRNVQLTSYNMDLRLKWSPPVNETCEVLYSTQLWPSFQKNPRAACVNTTALLCELSDPSLNLHISEFGRYKASVRGQCGAERSEWVESQVIVMDRDTVIGPPNVSLASSGADLEVIVRNPEFNISKLAFVYTPVQYNISYWPQGRQDRAVHLLVHQDRVTLDDLEPRTEYCVQVRVFVNPVRNSHPTVASEPVCATTEDSKEPSAPWIAAVLTFFALAIVVALVVISVVYHKRICHFLCPQDPLPQHLPECLHLPSHLMPAAEVYHPLHVVPCQYTEEPTLPDRS